MAKEYFSSHKMAFNPSLFNLAVISGLTNIYEVVTATSMHKFVPCIRSLQSLGWVEQIAGENLLRASINASENGLEPSYTSVWLQAQDVDRTIEVLFMESTKDMLAWMDFEQSTIEKIRAANPT